MLATIFCDREEHERCDGFRHTGNLGSSDITLIPCDCSCHHSAHIRTMVSNVVRYSWLDFASGKVFVTVALEDLNRLLAKRESEAE